MKKWVKISLLLIACLIQAQSVFAQNKAQLDKKRERIQSEIKKLNSLLGETKLNKKKSEIQLIILKKKIGARQELIGAINYEVKLIDQEIKEKQAEIDSLNSNLNELRSQYTQMVLFAYKNRNATNKLIFIFSADDFNQAYKRLKYIHEIGEYRKYQSELIVKSQKEVALKIQELEAKKQSKLNLLRSKETEAQTLKGEQNEKEDIYKELRQNEKKLKSNLEEKQRESKKLQDAIKKIIEREMKEALKKSATTSTGTKEPTLTPKAQKLSDNFTSNIGKLPWPVEKGTITARFGNQKHAVFEHVQTINNGIDILTNKGGKAQVVFKGKVVAVIVLPGEKNAVLVQHGIYFTMYSNLQNVYVKKGDELETGQEIGTVKTDESGKTELHFEIWKGNEKQDPSAWILKK